MRNALASARGLLFAVMAVFALHTAPAAAADTGSGTFAGTIDKKPVSVTFKDVYAFRAVSDRKTSRIVVHMTDTPMDKPAMTAALRKHRKSSAITTFGTFLDGKAKATLHIEDGKVTYLYIYSPPGHNLNLSGMDLSDLGKGEIKITTGRLEGRFFTDGKPGPAGKIDLRFATDFADTGSGAPIED
jgi:hypothetical protein